MKQVTPKQVNTFSLRHRLREGWFILLVAAAAYLFLSLVTYHNSDPGWSSSGTGGFIANAGGLMGAWFSDVFLYIFGYMAYLFPIMMLIAGLYFFRERQSEEHMPWSHVILRTVGFLLTLTAGAGLFGLYLSTWQAHVPLNAGGVLGSIVSHGLSYDLSTMGTTLILSACGLVGVTLFTGLSWITILQQLLSRSWVGLKALVRYYFKWRDDLRDKKALMQAREEKVVEQPRQVKSEPSEEVKLIESPLIFEPTKKSVRSEKPIKVTGTLPSLSLLDSPQKFKSPGYTKAKLVSLSQEVEDRLLDFGIEVSVVGVHPGPIITRFELKPAPGLKASRITALAKDLARSLSVTRVRIVEVIPGKSVIGLEIPNADREIVCLREIFESKRYQEATSPLSLAIGKDTSGYPVVVDLTKMPHLLVAGTTGSGKSVSLNAMLFSILFKALPEDVRLILIDPKMLELSVYDGIPHLLTPVVTDMKEAANAFRWCVAEMDRRYQLMASQGVRNLAAYNEKIKQAINLGKPITNPFASREAFGEMPPILEPLPCIVLVVDELADMMMLVGKKVEELIARIAQKARAAGIHMILATQRPSVDVITGLIKSNIPTRIAFQVSSKIDSRTILDQSGAEQLLGHGDMLYLPPGMGHPIRVHGAFVSDEEVHRVVADWKQRGEPEYLEEVLQSAEETNGFGEFGEGGDAEQDELYDQAVNIVTETRRASISYVQRRLKIGYNRAARMLESMEAAGVVSVMGNNGSREVLAPPPVED